MSPSLPIVSEREVVRALTKVGFGEGGQRGCHVKLRNEGGRTVIDPMHRELARGTLRSILRHADLTVDAFSRAAVIRRVNGSQASEGRLVSGGAVRSAITDSAATKTNPQGLESPTL